jgi:hypothetical protein
MQSNRNADDHMQRAVLGLVLHHHPTILTIDDLAREIGADDVVEGAVRDLTVVGLLRREGDSILATSAALHFDRLGA